MGKSNYRSVSIPDELIKPVEKLVKRKYKGYTSVAEFVKEAVRLELTKAEA